MKKWYIIGSIFVLCGVVIVGVVWLCIKYRDKTVLEQAINPSCTVRIRAKNFWDGAIPVYLEVHRKGNFTLTTLYFDRYTLDAIESRKLELEIHTVDTIIFIHPTGMPERILAMVDLKDNLVYPGYGSPGDTYNLQIQQLFSELKNLLHNDKLTLAE